MAASPVGEAGELARLRLEASVMKEDFEGLINRMLRAVQLLEAWLQCRAITKSFVGREVTDEERHRFQFHLCAAEASTKEFLYGR